MIRRIIRRNIHRLAILGILGIVLVAGGLFYLSSDLPKVEPLKNPKYSLPSMIYDRHGQLVDKIFTQRRKLVTYEQLPPHLVNALVAKEDSRFFSHYGIDPLRILKAAWIDLKTWSFAQGASTITQQTARLFFLSPEKKYIRKIKEILLALRIESEFTKQEIINLYMNKANFGDAYGVAAAAEFYFDKNVENLTLAEIATLVGVLPLPNRYKPTESLSLARKHRDIVLARMAEEGYITRGEQMAASSEPMKIAAREDPVIEAAASYVELVRRYLQEEFGNKHLYEGGMRVYTAMDLAYQTFAHHELLEGVRRLDRRRGYRGPKEKLDLGPEGKLDETVLLDLNSGRRIEIGQIMNGVVMEVNEDKARVVIAPFQEGEILWDLLKERWPSLLDNSEPEHPVSIPIRSLADVLAPGDRIRVAISGHDPITNQMRFDLHQEPKANGAVFVMEPTRGDVLAMVGGIRYGRKRGGSEFIRATQAVRQPGSSFKPIIYAAAIEEGYTPASLLEDSPRVFTLETGKKHTPHNYDNAYLGPLTLRESLVRSRNVPTVQLVDEMGARTVIKYARKFGISTPIPEESIIALGTHSVKLSELTRAYAVFPNGGKMVKPIYILRVEDSQGNVLQENHPESVQAISEATAFIISDILRDVVRIPFGTGYRAMEGLKRPAAGKTGTTQNYTDAWYMGFLPQLVAGVYVGFDDPTISLGPSESGGRAAAPIWKGFIERVESSLPIEAFKRPDSVVTLRIGLTGNLLDPCDEQQGSSRFEVFKTDSVPRQMNLGKNCGLRTLNSNVDPPLDGSRRREEEEL